MRKRQRVYFRSSSSVSHHHLVLPFITSNGCCSSEAPSDALEVVFADGRPQDWEARAARGKRSTKSERVGARNFTEDIEIAKVLSSTCWCSILLRR